jgi:SAM-dependent methyltransferase
VSEDPTTRSYLDAYSRFTDEQVEIDPHRAVGGAWEEFGELQFAFLKRRGLLPHHRLLDIGCGTLRAGRHFVRYLDPDCYYGFDISPRAIEYGTDLLRSENLDAKRARLWVVAGDLRFRDLASEQFDFALAQSVFTHLPPESITECFDHITSVLSPSGAFYFTYNDAAALFAKPIGMDFRYPLSFFEELAGPRGFQLADLSDDYAHPRGQRMVELRPIVDS